jgi:predicted deacylase
VRELLLSIPVPFGPAITLTKNSWEGSKSSDHALSIVSGLHGDQMNGVYINSLLTQFMDRVTQGQEPGYKLKGNVQIFPVVNIPAAHSGSRLWPFDDLDYDLAFPGNNKGEVAEQIARAILTHTADSTHGVILKTADLHYEDAAHCQLVDPDRRTKKMARSLGLDFARVLPELTNFQLSLFGHWMENDIAALMISLGKPGALDRSLCDSVFLGLVDLMVLAGVLTGGTKKEIVKQPIYETGAEHSVYSSYAGLFVADVEVGVFLEKGQNIGWMTGIETGDVLEEYAAPEDGYLVTLRHYPLTFAKESIATLLTEKKSGFWPF